MAPVTGEPLCGRRSGAPSTVALFPACRKRDVSALCFRRVPTVPVKNLSGSSPVNPALAGKEAPAEGRTGRGPLGWTRKH